MLSSPHGDHEPARSPEVEAAFARTATAYAAAQRGVFSHYPDGLPPREQLPDEQRRLLDELEDAEVALDLLRRQEDPGAPVGPSVD